MEQTTILTEEHMLACYQRKLDTFLNSQDINSKDFVSVDMIIVSQG